MYYLQAKSAIFDQAFSDSDPDSPDAKFSSEEEGGEDDKVEDQEEVGGDDQPHLSLGLKKMKLKQLISSREQDFHKVALGSIFANTKKPMNDKEHLVNIIAVSRQLSQTGHLQQGSQQLTRLTPRQ